MTDVCEKYKLGEGDGMHQALCLLWKEFHYLSVEWTSICITVFNFICLYNFDICLTETYNSEVSLRKGEA